MNSQKVRYRIYTKWWKILEARKKYMKILLIGIKCAVVVREMCYKRVVSLKKMTEK